MSRDFSKSFYNSKEWQAVRDGILMRDNYLCVKCGKPAEEVHHKIHLSPDNIGDPNITMNPGNLVSLCRDCHFAEHRLDKARGHLRNDVLPEIYFDESGMPHAPH